MSTTTTRAQLVTAILEFLARPAADRRIYSHTQDFSEALAVLRDASGAR